VPGLVPPVELAPPPTSVLDASALLAVVRDEPGATIVVRAIADGAAVSVFNWTEVLSVVAAGGDDPSPKGCRSPTAPASRSRPGSACPH